MLILIATLTVRGDSVEEFRAYERRAAGILASHGARIERTVVVRSDAATDILKEVHIVRFPDAEALQAYRADPGLQELAAIRTRVVVDTEILVGDDGPDYHGTAV